MLIRDIITEGYADELVKTVQRTLISQIHQGAKKISVDKLMTLMSRQGSVASRDELLAALDQSGLINPRSDDEYVEPVSEFPDDIEQAIPPDIGDMANNQAMDDIKDEI